MPQYRSRTSTHGRNMAGARALWRATGMQDVVMRLDLIDAMIKAADPNVSDAEAFEAERNACPTCGSPNAQRPSDCALGGAVTEAARAIGIHPKRDRNTPPLIPH